MGASTLIKGSTDGIEGSGNTEVFRVGPNGGMTIEGPIAGATPAATPAASLKELSLDVGAGGTSFALAIGVASASFAAVPITTAVISPTVDCFVRATPGASTAVVNTDQFLPGGQSYRLRFPAGSILSLITATGSGTAYLTPGA